MLNSHRPTDTTGRSCLCRVRWCELNLETVWQSLISQPIDHSRRLTFSEEVYAYSHMQQSSRPQRVYILRGVQRRCVWVVWRLGVAACLACVEAAAARPLRPPDALRRRPDRELYVRTWLNSHRHTRHDNTVLCVSCLAWRCELGSCY